MLLEPHVHLQLGHPGQGSHQHAAVVGSMVATDLSPSAPFSCCSPTVEKAWCPAVLLVRLHHRLLVGPAAFSIPKATFSCEKLGALL